MKTTLTIFALLIINLNVSGQSKKLPPYKIEVDTLAIKSDSVLAKICTYSNNQLKSEVTAYLIPDSIRIPRFAIARDIFKTTVYVDRLLKHGKTIEYSSDNNKKITDYHYGKAIATSYYDENNVEITKQQFTGDLIQIGPCITDQEYLLPKQKPK